MNTEELSKEVRLCECGCQKRLIWRNRYHMTKKWPRFIRGHHNNLRTGKSLKEIYGNKSEEVRGNMKAGHLDRYTYRGM